MFVRLVTIEHLSTTDKYTLFEKKVESTMYYFSSVIHMHKSSETILNM